MENGFNLEIIVPAGQLVNEKVAAVTLPTELGQVGILPEHADYTALLGTGILEYNAQSGVKKLVVSGGFLSFARSNLKILADSVDTPESVDKAGYAKDRSNLESILKDNPMTSPEWISAKNKIDRIEAIERLLNS